MSGVGPMHDLALMRELVKTYTPRPNVIKRAKDFVGTSTPLETIPIMREVIASLLPDDFIASHQEDYGGPLWLDDYAKVNDYGLWFFKLALRDDELIVCSCHESNRDEIRLRNGTTLRKP